jgi:hypothetical protein
MPPEFAKDRCFTNGARCHSLVGLHYGWQTLMIYSRWQCVDSVRDAAYSDFRVPTRGQIDAGVTCDAT